MQLHTWPVSLKTRTTGQKRKEERMTSQRSWTNAAIFQFFNFLWTRQTPKLSPKPDMTASQTLGGGHHRDLVLTDHHPALRLTTEPTPTRLSDSNRRPEPTRRPPKWTRDPDRSAWQTLGGGRHRDPRLMESPSGSSVYYKLSCVIS